MPVYPPEKHKSQGAASPWLPIPEVASVSLRVTQPGTGNPLIL